HQLPGGFEARGDIVGMGYLRTGHPEQLLARIAGQGRHRRVHLEVAAEVARGDARERHPDRRVLECALEALLALAGTLVRLLRLTAHLLIETSGPRGADARPRDEETVDSRPLPRMRDRVGVVV